MTFTERNYPAPAPSGEDIPDGVRVSLLSWFAERGIAHATELWHAYCQREGYGRYEEIAGDIGRRFGKASQESFTKAMAAHFEREKSRMVFAPGQDYAADPALRALPVPQFLDVLEMAVHAAEYHRWEAVEEINRLFSRRGVYFRFTERGLAEWHGDESAHTAIVRPALDALADARLAGARSEFEAALAHLRVGTEKDREDTVEEAAKAVESVMKVLAAAHKVRLSGKEPAKALFDALAKANIVVIESDNVVQGAARLRNAYGGHGAGALPRTIPPGVPELTLRSAASAISYLSSLLP